MNYYYWIIGFLIIAVLMYYIYLFVNRETKIIKLNSTTSISEAQINNPNSLVYTFSLWIYAKQIDELNDTNIFQYGNDITLNISPELHLRFSNITITEYFPLEQWVFVVISANKNILDFYLDGKLVKSIQLNTILNPPDKKIITIGNNNHIIPTDIRLANFKRVPQALPHFRVAIDYENNKHIKDLYKFAKYNLEISLNSGNNDEKTYSLYTREKKAFTR